MKAFEVIPILATIFTKLNFSAVNGGLATHAAFTILCCLFIYLADRLFLRSAGFCKTARCDVDSGLAYPLVVVPIFMHLLFSKNEEALWNSGLSFLFAIVGILGAVIPQIPHAKVFFSIICIVTFILTRWLLGFLVVLLASNLLVKLAPRCFTLSEAALLGVALGYLAFWDPLKTSMSFELAILWLLIVGSVLLVAFALLLNGLKIMQRSSTKHFYYALPPLVSLCVVTPISFVKLGQDPWSWALDFFFLKSNTNFLCVSYWCLMAILCFIFWPSHVYSKNMRRKYFHLFFTLAAAPTYLFYPEATVIAFALLLFIFLSFEILRVNKVNLIGPFLEKHLQPFCNSQDQGNLITSPFSLLIGIMVPAIIGLILKRHELGMCGFASVGIGDTFASVYGERKTTRRWSSTSEKTIGGTIAFAVTCFIFLTFTLFSPSFNFLFASISCALVEAATDQNDNYILPLFLMFALT